MLNPEVRWKSCLVVRLGSVPVVIAVVPVDIDDMLSKLAVRSSASATCELKDGTKVVAQ
jgi:hypothetical protein